MLIRALPTLLLLALISTAICRADDAPAPPDNPPGEAAQNQPPADAPPQPPAETHTCFVTGKPWEPSPERVEVVFQELGNLKVAHFLNMGYFVYALKDLHRQGRDLMVNKVSIVDYATFGTPSEHMVEIDRGTQNAWFVFTETHVKGGNPPYIFGFESEDSAKDFAKKNGGRIMDYASMLTKIGRQISLDEMDKGKKKNKTSEPDAGDGDLQK